MTTLSADDVSLDVDVADPAAEWRLRVQLAAAYRLFDHVGWTEMIYNHITVRVPGPEHHFLINPFGLLYSEVTASNLVKIGLDGSIIGPSEYPVNPAGFVIHSALHAAIPAARCIMHTHTTDGMAVASSRRGLVPTNFYSATMIGAVGYHDFEGLTVRDDEKARLVTSIGNKRALILRNHGLLAHGPTIPDAFNTLYRLQRACEVQVATSVIDEGLTISPEICEDSYRISFGSRSSTAHMLFDAMVRLIDKKDPSYNT
jgi:ribulose-5-phosphate 4-epimerase/fuculose-1-phosphate aldolase